MIRIRYRDRQRIRKNRCCLLERNPCFLRFESALRLSHSNRSPSADPYAIQDVCPSKMGARNYLRPQFEFYHSLADFRPPANCCPACIARITDPQGIGSIGRISALLKNHFLSNGSQLPIRDVHSAFTYFLNAADAILSHKKIGERVGRP